MGNFAYALKNDSTYRLGMNLGFLAGLLLFVSVIYFVTRKFKLLPPFLKYYEVVLFAAALYLIWLFVKKIKK